jgi:VWFA-related protein
LTSVLLVTGLAAQEPADGTGAPGGEPPTFSDVLDVRVVNVEVVVTDRDGRRVTGLGPDDLELVVDGTVVPIEYFSEVSDSEVVDPGAAAGAGGPAGIPSYSAGETIATSFLVFIDDYFSIRRDRNQILAALERQVEGLGARDRMAMVRFDGRELELLVTWTNDRAELLAALARARTAENRGLERAAEQRLDRVNLGESPDPLLLELYSFDLTPEERTYVARLSEQVRRAVAAASATLRSIAAPPGRKVMLLLSGGWPFDPIEYLVDNPSRPILESTLGRGENLFQPLTDTANQLGYTLYPVDVPGLVGQPLDSGSDLQADQTVSLRSGAFEHEANVHAALHFLAGETGGAALVNNERLDVLVAALADTRSFYWLGFTPARVGDDSRHRIVVRARRDGLRVRARDGYLDLSRRREVTLAVEGALYFGSPPSPEALVVRLGRPQRAGLRTVEVPLEVLIPARGLTYLPGPAGVSVQLELRIAVLDRDGSTTDTPIIPLPLSLAARPADTAHLRYDTAIKLRRKPHDLVVAIYDVSSGALFSTSVAVDL